ncbi:MAG: Tol-Pal system protein TolB, partial [Paracoccaceae bacterium]
MKLINALSFVATLAMTVLAMALPVAAQQGPLRIEITEGVIEPLPFAVPVFIAENPAAQEFAANIAQVIASDLVGTGLFREIPPGAFISTPESFGSPIQYADWKAINAQALVTGAVTATADGRLTVKFRVFDVFSDAQLGDGLQFGGAATSWRRMAHKVADAVYSRITGESGYFDSRVVFVSETGPKDNRRQRVAVMDYDGQNVQFLTDDSSIVLSPRFSPTGDRVLYTSYDSGFPRV